MELKIMTKLEKNGLIGTSRLQIICDGDSWVFGCEIADPELAKKYSADTHPGAYDFLPENDWYRIPKIFPTHLSNLLDAEVINLSWPADDNATILNRTVDFITNTYIARGISTDNLLVVIGWSSPERNSFWYKDDNLSRPFRLWPQVPNFDVPAQEEIWKTYVTYLWNAEEYIPRYVRNVIYLQNFCKAHNIKWMCFNSFYQTPKKTISDWKDLDIAAELDSIKETMKHPYHFNSTRDGLTKYNAVLDYKALWDTVDPIRFYKKDIPNNTFKSFIENPDRNINPVFTGWHPSPEAHKAWAQELATYIRDNNII